MQKNIVFIGGGIETYPGIEICKERNYKTILVDGNKNCYCKPLADYFIHASTYDYKSIVEKLKKNILNQVKIDAVLSLGVDVPYSVAYVAKKIGCKSIPLKTAKICSNKLEFKKKIIENGIPTSKYLIIKKKKDLKEISFKKSVLKPVDSRGARGVVVLSKKNISHYFKESFKHTNKNYILAEEFIEGPQLSTESIIINYKAKTFSVSDRNYKDTINLRPYMIENGSDMPSIYKKKFQKKIDKIISKLAKILNIKNGVIKGDLVIKKDKIYIIEAAPRLSGGFFCSHMLPISNGISIIDIYLDLLLFGKTNEDKLIEKHFKYVSQRFVFAKQGKIKKIKIDKNIKKKSDLLIIYKKPNQIQPKIKSHPDRSAMIICSDNNKKNLLLKINKLIKKIIFRVSGN